MHTFKNINLVHKGGQYKIVYFIHFHILSYNLDTHKKLQNSHPSLF